MRSESNGKGRTQPKSPPKKRGRPSDLVAWMPRREACQLLQSSVSTLRSWEGKRFRVKRSLATDGTSRVYYHRDDVERTRLEKLGPRQWEIERHVLAALAAGRAADSILHEVTHVTLGDVERIREQNARLSGACVLDADCVRELRQLLDLEMMTGRMLVLHVRALVERVERLAAMRVRRSTPPGANGSASGN